MPWYSGGVGMSAPRPLNLAGPDPSAANPSPSRIKPSSPVPILALSVQEACEALGVSWDTWRLHIEPEVRIVRCGRRKIVAVAELERWLDRSAERALDSRVTGNGSPR